MEKLLALLILLHAFTVICLPVLLAVLWLCGAISGWVFLIAFILWLK